RLPNAAGIAVTLFAFQFESARAVIHAEYELMLLARLESWRQFELKRDVTASVCPQRSPIQPGLCLPIAGADDQKHALSFPRIGRLNRPRIPGDGRFVRDLGQRRAPGKRHNNRIRKAGVALVPPLTQTAVVRIKPELPRPVQIQPGGALKIRT